MDLLAGFFDTSDFPARWQCGVWTPAHGWLHILSDLGVWSAYLAIPCVLGYFTIRRKDLPFRKVFALFVVFILACGTTHLMEAIIFWWPAYRLAGLLKLFTAIVSWATVIALVPIVPKALEMHSPEELQREIDARKEAEIALQFANADLERRIAARTAELSLANEALHMEVVERRLTEEALRQRVEEIESLMEFMPICILKAEDPDCRRISGNPEAHRLLRVPVGANLSQTPPPGEGSLHYRAYQDGVEIPPQRLPMQYCCRHGTEVRDLEFEIVYADGTSSSIYCYATPLFSGTGEVRGCLFAALDITERKKAENARQEAEIASRRSEARYKALIEATAQAVWTTDPSGVVLEDSPSWRRFTGQSLEQWLGMGWLDALHPDDRAGARQAWIDSVSGRSRYEIEYRLITPGGEFRLTRARAVPVLDDRERVVEWVGMNVDITDQRRAEDDREKFAFLVENSTDFIAICDLNYRASYINQAGLAMIGCDDLEKALGATVKDYFFPEDQAFVLEQFFPSLLRTGHGEVEIRFRHFKTGEALWMAYGVMAIKDRTGRIVGLATISRNVTERRRMDEAVRESEARWRTLAEALPNLVWTDTAEGVCDYLSSQWGRYTGVPVSELLGYKWLELLHPDDRERTRVCWQAAVADQGDYDLEYRIRRHDGVYRWFKTRGVPLRDAENRIVQWFGTCTDIEDQKRTEEALRESRERLNVALAASDTGTFRWEPASGRFLEFDENLKRLFGFPDGHPVEHLSDILGRIHPEDRDRVLPAIEAAGRGKDFDMEFRVRLPDGRVRWVYDRAKMAGGSGGEPAYLVGACTDINERKRDEEALLQADRRKDEFLATLAHELRNPLAPLRNGLQLLRMSEDRAVHGKVLGMMERQFGQLVRLVDDLLDISRITRNKLELRKARIELAAAVQNAVETVRPQIESAGHILKVNLPPGPVYLDADLTRLAQVFWNLLHNSAKYTDAGGTIFLTAERERDEVVVSVRDTGIGIPVESLPRLFEIFSQVDRSLERAQGGLGIGLALVKGLVEMHGGSIEARSEGLGRGSEFIVRLPVALEPTEVPGTPGEVNNGAVHRRRILVVDDNRDGAASLCAMLSLMGNEARSGHDGLEAVELAEAFHPDVILLDIGLPKLNGYDACRRIRGEPWGRDIVIIASTGWGQEEDRRRSKEAGFDHHMIKPIEPVKLQELLANLAMKQG